LEYFQTDGFATTQDIGVPPLAPPTTAGFYSGQIGGVLILDGCHVSLE